MGQAGTTRGFCNFESLEFGVRACAYLLIISYKKALCVTVRAKIRRFAPPSENDTKGYIDYVCGVAKLKPDSVPTTLDEYARMMHGMSIFEGNPVKIEDIKKVLEMFFIKYLD